MPWPPKFHALLGLFLLLTALPCAAAPVPTAVKGKSAAAPAAPLPDYGGRDAPLASTEAAGTDTPNPLAQAGRSVVALVIVLAAVVGVLYLLKRAGLTGAGASGAPVPPALSWLKPMLSAKAPPLPPAMSVAGSPFSLNVVQSQSLPGAAGVTLHLLSVNDETLLLLGATAQGVSLLAQWDHDGSRPDPEEAGNEKAAFGDYLKRAGIAPTLPPVHAVEEQMGATADRLQSLLAGSRRQASEETTR